MCRQAVRNETLCTLMNEDIADWLSGRPPLSLQALHLRTAPRVVMLAPHPDDFDAIAATMRFFQECDSRIDVAVVTSGASGVETGFGGASTPRAKAALREIEQQASCRQFGLSESRLAFLRLREDENGDPVDSTANLQCVRSFLLEHQPDMVFLPHWHDPNEGHRRTYAFFRQTVKNEKLSLTAFLSQDPKTVAMRHDCYFAFGDETASWKAELLRLHKSQHQRNLNLRGHGFDERILNVNREIAAALGLVEHGAEAFELERYCAGEASHPLQYPAS